MNDAFTGTRIRLGEVGFELAETLTEQGSYRLAREALSKPYVGMWFSKTF